MSAKTIHLIFKTHLDIGFTDHAEKVRRQYHERFIPQAIQTGEHFFAEDPDNPMFIWTTGAWLIHDHLATQPPESVDRLERAIERGLIRWHALPFTTHSELMSPNLFRAGLSYCAELDKRFGRKTTAAKMTDVPGHTRGIVPLLAEAGVKFLHLGVNTASPVPDVPDIFRWAGPDGSEIVVMYQNSYGATQFPEGFSEGISFAHTGDNLGPQGISQTVDIHRALRHHAPDADIRASGLDEYGEILWQRREEFPRLDIEIGDSWIHGSGSDPIKIQRFLALQRLYDDFCAEDLTPQRQAFGRDLAMVAEHTCGVDIKTFLRDTLAWDRPAFEAARQADYRFAYTEASWAEQRRYLDAAMANLGGADRAKAEAALAAAPAEKPAEYSEKSPEAPLQVGEWGIRIDPSTGDIAQLVMPGGLEVEGRDGSLMGYRYESYDANDITRHLDTYLTHREEWAILDHSRPGLEKAETARSETFRPRLLGFSENRLLLELAPEAHDTLGAPRQIVVAFRALDDGKLEIAVSLLEKPANRMPEASFLTFTPDGAEDWAFHKTGLWQPAHRVAGRGGGQLQAVSSVRTRVADGGAIELRPLDTPLTAPADTPFMQFEHRPPKFDGGVRFNLHNNKWATNFPMWWEGDFCARFVLGPAIETA